MTNLTAETASAKNFLNYLNASPSPWHAVQESINLLQPHGFTELKEGDENAWKLKKGGKYYIKRHGASLFAFAVGGKFDPKTNGRFSMVGAHTDSPCLRVKAVSKIEKANFIQAGVECYGGGTWPTWLDRDLRIAGRVNFKNSQGKLAVKLVHIDEPFCRVPTLAIHLARDQGTKLEINKEDHLKPVIATVLEKGLNVVSDEGRSSKPIKERHHSVLVQAVADNIGIPADDIIEFELCLADYTKAEIGGARKEFIYGPRLDNLLSSFACLTGFIKSSNKTLETDECCRVITLFDHEEIGSKSAQGAASALPGYILKRIMHGIEGAEDVDACCFERAIPKSFCISADMAHAMHPNYTEKHEQRFQLNLTGGPAIKYNTNQRYATNSQTASILRLIAEEAGVPLQEICNRNDIACGSTIGPITAGGLSIPTVDMGAPQWSMHSIREMCHVCCVKQCEDLFTHFFDTFGKYQAANNNEDGFRTI